MNTFLIAAAAVVGLLVLYQVFRRADLRKMVRSLRWIVGGLIAALTAFLLLRGQVAIASVTGYAAFSILKFGRLGPWSFESDEIGEDNMSSVRSRFIAMTLDHDAGTVEGRVVAGAFKGADLVDLGENETRQLLSEVAADPDSLALLQTWLDKNRAGWREYFAEQDATTATGGEGGDGSGTDPDTEAYEVLGLKPGATAEDVRAAHHKLMMGVHPDQGGSTYLAARINAAKDRLLKKLGAK
jgi:hypothetical protein